MIKKVKRFLFSNQNTRQTIAKNTFWLAFGNIGGRFIRAGVLIVAARLLQAQGFGVFSYALSLAAFFTVFIDLGINSVLVREASTDLSSQKRLFSTGLTIKLVMLTIVMLFVGFGVKYFVKDQQVIYLLPIIAVFVGFDSLKDFGSSLSRAWEKMEIEAAVQIITNVLIALGSGIALYIAPNPRSLAIGYATGTAIGALLSFFPFRQYFSWFWREVSLASIKRVFTASWIYGVMNLLSTILLNTDILMIGWFRSIEDVGYYSAAQRIILIIYVAAGFVSAAAMPRMTKLAAEGKTDAIASIIQKTNYLLIAFALPAALGGAILSTEIIKLLYGASYIPAVSSLIILSFTFVPVFMAGIINYALFALKKDRHLLYYSLIGVFGNALFNIILIPKLGIAGSSLSTLINQFIIATYSYFALKRHLNFKMIGNIKNILIASGLMSLYLLTTLKLGAHFIIPFLGAIVVYLGTLYLLKDRALTEVRQTLSS